MSFQNAWDLPIVWFNELIDQARSIDPTQRAVLWIQLVAGSLTVVWIIFQFAWLRRLNEARLERYLEDRIGSERDFLAKERAEVLLKIERFSKARGVSRMVLLVWPTSGWLSRWSFVYLALGQREVSLITRLS